MILSSKFVNKIQDHKGNLSLNINNNLKFCVYLSILHVCPKRNSASALSKKATNKVFCVRSENMLLGHPQIPGVYEQECSHAFDMGGTIVQAKYGGAAHSKTAPLIWQGRAENLHYGIGQDKAELWISKFTSVSFPSSFQAWKFHQFCYP